MSFSKIELQVMWNRLLAVVEEQAQTLVRTAFGTAAREAGDVSAGVFDAQGRMLAQAVTGTPGHVNSMAASVKYFLEEFPADTMQDGDSFITNDPWKGTGHLSDVTVVTPAFHGGKLVGLFACTTHVVDIGGQGQSPDSRQVYNEGLWIPLLHLMRGGKVDPTLMKIVRQNVREPVQVEGDLYALAACNDIGARRLGEMMREYKLQDLEQLGRLIIDTTRTAMLKAIRAFPQGRAQSKMTVDGYERPVDLVATLTVSQDAVTVDYTGTSPTSDFGINCPKSYTDAYTAFGVKCIVAPAIPNNAGSLELIRTQAPEGCIVNAMPPCAVMARSIIGHLLPDAVFGCLHQIAPGRVPAEGTATLWSVKLSAGHGITPRPQDPNATATPFVVSSFHSGGTGARPTIDGLSATPFPSGVRSMPRSPRRSRRSWCGKRNTGAIPPGAAASAGDSARPWSSAAARTARSPFSRPSTAASIRRVAANPGSPGRSARYRWAAARALSPRAGRSSRPATCWCSTCRVEADTATRTNATRSRCCTMCAAN
jgi:N-methylhydantoinase B